MTLKIPPAACFTPGVKPLQACSGAPNCPI